MNNYLIEFARSFPRPIRKFLGYSYDYGIRIMRWLRILACIRGVTLRDKYWLFMSALAAPFTCGYRLSVWQNPILLKNIRIYVRDVGIFDVRARSDDLFHVLPFGEPSVVERVQCILRSGDTFVDAGANIGFYSVLAARLVGPTGHVIAVEMMPQTAAILRHHIQLNHIGHIVSVVELALSDEPHQLITAHYTVGLAGQSSIVPGINVQGNIVTVESTTLDKLCEEVGRIRLVKMDIEGAELSALNGAKSVLSRIENIIYENVFDDRVGNYLQSSGFIVTPMYGKECFATRVMEGNTPSKAG